MPVNYQELKKRNSLELDKLVRSPTTSKTRRKIIVALLKQRGWDFAKRQEVRKDGAVALVDERKVSQKAVLGAIKITSSGPPQREAASVDFQARLEEGIRKVVIDCAREYVKQLMVETQRQLNESLSL